MLVHGLTTPPEWSYRWMRRSRYPLHKDISSANRLQGWCFRIRYALVSRVFARVLKGLYALEVNLHTALIISHLASTSSSRVRSGLRRISSPGTGRDEFAALQVHDKLHV
jgi:hypothetical protein